MTEEQELQKAAGKAFKNTRVEYQATGQLGWYASGHQIDKFLGETIEDAIALCQNVIDEKQQLAQRKFVMKSFRLSEAENDLLTEIAWRERRNQVELLRQWIKVAAKEHGIEAEKEDQKQEGEK